MDQNSTPSHQNLSKQAMLEPTKQRRKKKQSHRHHLQQVKVVHFSNPVRVTTTVAKFQALVQELTGRDSYIADLLAGNPPATGGQVCGDYVSLDLLAGGGGGFDQDGIFDCPPPEFRVESGCGEGVGFDICAERFGRVEDFGEVLMESVVLETPMIAGDGFCGWML